MLPSCGECRVCGEEIGKTENGDLFVACHDCGFPVCWPCYKYERTEGNRKCPQCHSLYKESDVEGEVEEIMIDGRRGEGGGDDREEVNTEGRQPLWEKIPVSPSKTIPYRIVVILRLIIVAFYLRYRILNPLMNNNPIWLIVDFWLALSWILDQFPRCFPVVNQTHLDRLSLQFDPNDNRPSTLAPIDFFVTSADIIKEPPILTANTVLSILAVDYPVDKVSCYVSDDGASKELFDTLSETSEFARRWVPFCKKHCIEPRAPDFYFSDQNNIDYDHMDNVGPSFLTERTAIKREYEEFKVKINALVAKGLNKPPKEGWVMNDGTPWSGNMIGDHPAIIEEYLGSKGALDVEGNELPQVVYVSREKRPGFNNQKKAGAMNALVRISAVLSNAPFILNLDCDHYVNNSKAVREAMCFLMDPHLRKKLSFVQFPQRFYGVDQTDLYANHNLVFSDIIMKGLDGIQGPLYVGTGCVLNRRALYGNDPQMSDTEVTEKGSLMKFQKNMTKRFGQSELFIASTHVEDGGLPENTTTSTTSKADLIDEAIHVISCEYEEDTEWGEEISWIYGSVTEDILTGFKMHYRGWRSVYCMPDRAAFKGTAPINLTDRLKQSSRWARGSIEMLRSRHCPLFYGWGGKLKLLERLSYINVCVYPFTSIPLLAYCSIPAISLLFGSFNISTMMNIPTIWLMALFLSIVATAILEIQWGNVSIMSFWRVEQYWMVSGVSSYLFAIFQGLFDVQYFGRKTKYTVTIKPVGDERDDEFGDFYRFKWSPLLISPTILITLNVLGVVVGVQHLIMDINGFGSWEIVFWKFFAPLWIIAHLYPFLKGLMGRHGTIPYIVVFCVCLFFMIESIMSHVRPPKALVTTCLPGIDQFKKC